METVRLFDFWLFERINKDGANAFFDSFFPTFTELHKVPAVTYVLIPALLLLFMVKLRFRFISFLMTLVLAIAITDSSAHHLIKKYVERPRPMQTEGLAVELRTFSHAGYSFPSNHASNSFAAAMVLSAYFYSWRRFFYLFAFLIAYSRIYVGVHFPLDVVAGALWGSIIAFGVLKALRPFDTWIRMKFPTANNFPNL